MIYRKFDMHCHTKEGSVDSEVSVWDYAKALKAKGFGGMLVTDHDSYAGYDCISAAFVDEDFTILKGIEYDTCDYGHFIVIMPDDDNTSVLKYRGLKAFDLISIVHENGGITGPAHPCGEPFLSMYSTGIRFGHINKVKELLPLVDFFEGYNAAEDEMSNYRARVLAHRYNRPMTGGSDAHWMDCVGLGYVYLPQSIKSNNDLIKYIKSGEDNLVGGRRYGKTTKDKLGPFNKILVALFYPYNKWKSIINYFNRKNSNKFSYCSVPDQ